MMTSTLYIHTEQFQYIQNYENYMHNIYGRATAEERFVSEKCETEIIIAPRT